MRAFNGPSLPQSLLEEIDPSKAEGRGNGRFNSRGKGRPSRKESRKQERQVKKQRKVEYFTGAQAQGAKRFAAHEHADSPHRKKQKLETSSASNGSRKVMQEQYTTKPKPKPTSSQTFKSLEKKEALKRSKPPTALEKLDSRSISKLTSKNAKANTGIIPKSRHEEEEDAYISYLESKLGWKKGGRKSSQYCKELEDDGLDELLQDLDQLETSIFTTAKGNVSGETSEDGIEEEDAMSDINEDVGESDEDEDEEAVTDAEEEWGGIGGDEDPSADSDVEDIEEDVSANTGIFDTQEIESAPATKYIPPHLRNRPAESVEDSDAKLKLIRQLKGQLNRMSEQNIGTIIDAVEEMYRNHRRHDVTSAITTLITDGISAHSILLDSYVVLHAAFISALHKLIGVEFAAYFVQNLVASYEKHFASLQTAPTQPDQPQNDQQQSDPQAGKETSNLAVLLSELYNFQVISCVLVYDIIRGLLEGDLTEFKVELLLKVARNSGQQLRTDDPSALKDIIEIVHSKLPDDKNALSSRTRFMVETLTNLKNNKVKKTAAGQMAGSEAVERMKKWLAGLTKKRHVRTHEPLRVSLQDLRSAETKGKWWLVGAAWGGDPLVDRHETSKSHPSAQNHTAVEAPSENKLLKLARKQGMNTDIRRSIFVVLMSSEDYVHACERLSQLKLTEVQQREIIRVILHCCGNEKLYNPYYTLIGQQLCRLSHSHKFTLQYCLWDFLRDLGEVNVGGAEIIKNLKEDDVGFDVKNISSSRMSNIARAFGWWIAKDCVTLAILKPVDFTILKAQSRRFLVQLMMHICISSQLSTPLISSDPKDIPKTRNRGAIEEVFIKSTRIQALSLGLMYFLNEVVKPEVGELDDSRFLSWANKVALDTLRTGLDVVPTL